MSKFRTDILKWCAISFLSQHIWLVNFNHWFLNRRLLFYCLLYFLMIHPRPIDLNNSIWMNFNFLQGPWNLGLFFYSHLMWDSSWSKISYLERLGSSSTPTMISCCLNLDHLPWYLLELLEHNISPGSLLQNHTLLDYTWLYCSDSPQEVGLLLVDHSN